MLMPKKVKFRKQQRGRMTGKAWRGSALSFGDYGLKAMDCGWVTNRQIEAARRSVTNYLKRGGKIWIRIFPDKPATKIRSRSMPCAKTIASIIWRIDSTSPDCRWVSPGRNQLKQRFGLLPRCCSG